MSGQSFLDDFEVFPWSENFETGVREIDEQHKKLVDLLNNLANVLTQEEPGGINQAFEELAQYADYHFASEEAIWSESFKDDPWFVSHQSAHSSFLPQVLELQKKDKHKPFHVVVEDILKFLIRWLAFHIIDDDKRLAVAIDAMASGSSLEEAKAIANGEMNDSVRVLIDTIMMMYDRLSSRTLSLMRERHARQRVEAQLREVNRSLEKLTITDQLTGIYNRRYFDSVISDELKQICIYQSSLNLILFDIDFFKKLNDCYGHSCGDDALQKVGQLLNAICHNEGDYAFRLGGEEFAVISVATPGKAELISGEQVRQQIESLKVPNRDSVVSDFMTVSVGELIVEPANHQDISELMKRVDQRLYTAKNSGRNRVVDY
ncbi:GGDEF domain-containing protein [Marinobacterium jannaschii]|uniref:GGDEF domain-containing protein n=1 Tax=Marinobacterium jannaschii TaxID=64970 RepID=UPI00047FC850|nr:bacteriohemerythrin [Marinobacterium jannaschii]